MSRVCCFFRVLCIDVCRGVYVEVCVDVCVGLVLKQQGALGLISKSSIMVLTSDHVSDYDDDDLVGKQPLAAGLVRAA